MIEFTFYDDIFPRTPTKSEKRKLQLLEQTITEIAEFGIDQLTHESLAKACRVSRPLVHHYFPDREELIHLAIRAVRARFQKLCIDEIRKHTEPARQFEAYLLAVCHWADTSPKDVRVWLLFYYYCGTREEYQKLNTELVEQGEERIQAMMKAGNTRISAQEATTKAKLVQNLVTGYFISSVTEAHSPNIRRKLIADTVNLALELSGYSLGRST